MARRERLDILDALLAQVAEVGAGETPETSFPVSQEAGTQEHEEPGASGAEESGMPGFEQTSVPVSRESTRGTGDMRRRQTYHVSPTMIGLLEQVYVGLRGQFGLGVEKGEIVDWAVLRALEQYYALGSASALWRYYAEQTRA